MATAPIERVVGQLTKPVGGNGKWHAFCPAHDDRNNPSLTVTEGDDGRVLLHCHAGCETETIVTALGLTMADLFAADGKAVNSNGHKSTDDTVSAGELEQLVAYVEETRRRLRRDDDVARRARKYGERFGLTADELLELGLGVDPGNTVINRPPFLSRFAGVPRLVVPFYRADGTVGGLQGRAIVPVDDTKVKRWESPIGKGWARIGYFALAAPGPVIVTEGPGDALTAAGAGYAAAAVRGASLFGPVSAAQLAADLSGRVAVVAGDDDKAGRTFRDRLSVNLRAEGLRTAVLEQIPHGDLTAWHEAEPEQFAEQLQTAVGGAEILEPPQPPAPGLPPDESPGGDHGPGYRRYTDAGNALRLVDQHHAEIRYVGEWTRWIVWDGTRWERDANLSIVERAKAVANGLFVAAKAMDDDHAKAAEKFARETEAANRLRAMVDLARSDPRVAVRLEVLDLDQWLLNVANGTVDLRTGQLRPHRREDLITKKAPVVYDPAAECPLWMAFLNRIMGDDEDLVAFLQRAVGYSLTGSVREQCLLLLYGSGANGKTTFLTTIMNMLGVDEYSLKTPKETLVARREGAIPNDLARLRGSRLVYASETEAGAKLAESMVKDLTGGDVISARFMRGEWFDFTPVCKVWLATNHRPVIRGTDEAIWRRIRLVPFTVTIPEDERDHELEHKLAAELPGILNWAIQGCLEWQRRGLGVPEVVATATAGYRGEMDVIGQFLADRCVLHPNSKTPAKALYEHYKAWCAETGEYLLSQRALGDRLREKGLESYRSDGKWWRGVGIVEFRKADGDSEPYEKGSEGSVSRSEGSEKVPPPPEEAAEGSGTLEPSGTFPPIDPHAHARSRDHAGARAHEASYRENVPEGSEGSEPENDEEQGEWNL